MHLGSKPLNRDQVDRLLELPGLDQRSRQALQDHALSPAAFGASELRAILAEDPVVAKALKSGARFIRATSRGPLLQLFPEHAPEPREPRRLAPAPPAAAPLPVPPPRPAVPVLGPDPSLDRLDRVLETLVSQPEGSASLSLKLYRIEDKGAGFEKKVFAGVAVDLDAADLPGTDLGLEERTQAHAQRTGAFGAYVWSIKAFADGGLVMDTTRKINVEPPPDYRAALAAGAPAMPSPDPRAEARESLGMLRDLVSIASGLGGGKSGPSLADLEAARASGYQQGHTAGKAEGLREADREWQSRMDAKLEAAKAEAYGRGKVDGRRDAEDAFRERERELERRAEGDPPSMVQEVVNAIGGPDTIKGLVAAIASGALSNKRTAAVPPGQTPRPLPGPAPAPPAPSTSGRPPMPLARPAPLPQPAPEPEPVAPGLPEPSRADFVAAMETLDEATALLEEAMDQGPEAQAQLSTFHGQIQAFRSAGIQEGPLGTWWKAWREEVEPNVLRVIEALEASLNPPAEAPQEADTMPDISALKSLLRLRLQEGAAPEAILEELRRTVDPGTLNEWKELVAFAPEPFALRFLGIPEQHQEAGAAVLRAFKAAS